MRVREGMFVQTGAGKNPAAPVQSLIEGYLQEQQQQVPA